MRKEENLNKYIHPSHFKAVEKFNAELEAWCKETGEDEAVLHEDAFISFTLSDVRIENGYLCYCYDGEEEREKEVLYDETTDYYYENTDPESIMEYIKFWRSCLRRSRKYWSMDSETLDKIADGEIEDITDEEE